MPITTTTTSDMAGPTQPIIWCKSNLNSKNNPGKRSGPNIETRWIYHPQVLPIQYPMAPTTDSEPTIATKTRNPTFDDEGAVESWYSCVDLLCYIVSSETANCVLFLLSSIPHHKREVHGTTRVGPTTMKATHKDIVRGNR
jgi:hypothetical protein